MPFFGRNPIYIGTLLVFVLLQLAVIYAQNFGMLLAFRFLTGFIGSPVLATGGATIADMYAPNKQTYGIAVWGISAVCGPALGPLVGGFAAESKGWQWTIWELMWLSGACLVFLTFFLPETSSSNILYRRTIRYRKLTGNPKLKCKPELEAEGMTGSEIVQMTLIRPFTLSFTEPIVFLLNLYIALVYALLYLWFESFPIVFIGSSLFSVGAFLLFMSVLTYLGDAYPKYVASVYAGNDLVRSSFGAGFPLFANAMYTRLGVGWATSLLGFLSIAFIPIPFVLYFYGERIRGRSKMARHDL